MKIATFNVNNINKRLPLLLAWLKKAKEHPGSWWPDWIEWIKSHGEERVEARQPGDGKLTPIEDAPGRYVKVQA